MSIFSSGHSERLARIVAIEPAEYKAAKFDGHRVVLSDGFALDASACSDKAEAVRFALWKRDEQSRDCGRRM